MSPGYGVARGRRARHGAAPPPVQFCNSLLLSLGDGRFMELRHMRYFVAVAEALSFTKAAKNLRLAQPSLTRQVRNLENELGLRLLDRSHNRVTLTEEGRVFFLESKRLLERCADLVTTVQRMSGEDSARINIGYVANVPCSLLPGSLAAFRKLSPRVVLNLFDMNSAEQLQALDSRRIDLGFTGLPPAPSPNHCARCITHDVMVAGFPQSHPLARKPRVKISDLAAEFFIGMSAATHPGEREWLLATCRHHGFTPKILQETDGEPAAIKSVADGLGITLMPVQVSGLPHEGVVFRAFATPLTRESAVVWRTDDHSAPVTNYLRILRDMAQ